MPVMIVGDQTIVGFDEERIRKVLGIESPDDYQPEWEGLDPGDLAELGTEAPSDVLSMRIYALLGRIQHEMEYNASKGVSAYRFGQHDGLRFARDALIRLMRGTPEFAALSSQREGDPEAGNT